MTHLSDNLEDIAERIRQDFTAKDAAREKALPLCRDVIRHSSLAIRAVHRQEFEEARHSLHAAQDILAQIDETPDIEFKHAGFIKDAQKEFAEGSITLAIVKHESIPGPEELKVDPAAYLNGLGEAVGELRRYLLDGMRRNDLSKSEDFLEVMDDIYSILVTMDFPDAITGGLRRTTDVVRGILEKTRSDLTLVMKQKELQDKLDDYQQ